MSQPEKIHSLALAGIEGYGVTVECDISGGLPSFDVVGLPDAAVREARERVRAAMKNSGLPFPSRRITVNLAPADTKKAGSIYDLPILLSLLLSAGEINPPPPGTAFIGELSLYGELRPCAGALPMAMAAPGIGIRRLFCPADSADEAALAPGVEVYPVKTVAQLLAHLRDADKIEPSRGRVPEQAERRLPDYADVMGQEQAKRALEIAAAGAHNILMVGPPGAGKSMLAERLPSILPSMTTAEALETTMVHSVAGLTSAARPMITARPFRAPHHTISASGLAGGGARPRPGEISLAHGGVLFLDELPQFQTDALESLRQPLESGSVTISRVAGSLTYPCRFMLVCAMNPCRCGWYGDASGRCKCSEASVASYLGRVSGPLLDRIDIHIEVPPVAYSDLENRVPAESSQMIRARVEAARERARERFGAGGASANAYIPPSAIGEICRMDAEAADFMRSAFARLGMTARSYDKVLRVARTVADLDGADIISRRHVAEAVQYRSLDRRGL